MLPTGASNRYNVVPAGTPLPVPNVNDVNVTEPDAGGMPPPEFPSTDGVNDCPT
jgi:hypothetical protein